MYTRAIVALLFIGCVSLVDPATAQTNVPGRERVPVTIAITDRMPVSGSEAIIIRRPASEVSDDAALDVILVRRGFEDARTLTRVIRDLITIREATGDVPHRRGIFRVRREDGALPTTTGVLPWAGRVLADLNTAPPLRIDEVGRVPAVRIWLPAHPSARGAM